MKRKKVFFIIKIVFVIASSLILGLFLFKIIAERCTVGFVVSCINSQQDKEQKWFNEYMSKIPVDINGYELGNLNKINAIKIENTSGEFIVQDTKVTIYINEGEGLFDISFNKKTFRIDEQFINQRTDSYGKINELWSSYRKEESTTSLFSKVDALMVYEGNIYIFTNGINDNMWGGCLNQYPVAMYTYDIISDKILYLGYFNDVNSKNKNIIKNGELYFTYNNE